MRTEKLLLTGDVMTGRGIDQILQRPCDPVLYEDYVKSALDYVTLAEEAHGPIPRKVPDAYVWGDALGEIEKRKPRFRLVNLETAITADGTAEPKGINYRMHPANIGVLSAVRIDGCILANNHILDWGTAGLAETLETLRRAGIASAGAGVSDTEAAAPLVHRLKKGSRVLVYAFGARDSGIPSRWAARAHTPGVNLLPDFSQATIADIAASVEAVKQPGDIAIASIHWGSNWGYEIASEHREFAHGLIDQAMIDVIHGHSSHHAKPIEVWHGKLVLYGCGDLINDYEGIRGYEDFRTTLALTYFPELRADGTLRSLEMAPFRVRAFRLEKAGVTDAAWIADTLSRESQPFGTSVEMASTDSLQLRWR